MRGGVYGVTPAMGDLDGSGNLKASTDFRLVYATALRWMGADPTPILGGDYGDLGFLDWPTDAPVTIGGGSGPPSSDRRWRSRRSSRHARSTPVRAR